MFFKIEDDQVDLMQSALTIIAAMSLQEIRKARIELGESVLVMGLGLLGMFAVNLARLHGGLPVVALDFDLYRRKLAIQLGADAALSPDEESFDERFRQLTQNRGADAVIKVTGSSEAVKQALRCASPRGRVVLLGCNRQLTDGMDFYQDVHKPGTSVIGAHNFLRPRHDSSPGYWTLRDDMQSLLHLLASGRMSIAPLIGLRVTPNEAPGFTSECLMAKKDCLAWC